MRATTSPTQTTRGILQANRVTVRLAGRVVLDDVSLQVRSGEVVALVGPNGAGKSTLAAVLAGDQTPEEGEVRLAGAPLGSVSSAERARRRAVLAQDGQVTFPFRSDQVVMMGRYPRLRRGQFPGQADDEAVAQALAATDTSHLAPQAAPTLSGGEHSRVCMARVLAQDTQVIILDEPTASLDLHHQQQLLELCHDLAADGRAVLAIVHDLNQAAAAHRVAVLDGGRLVADGTPEEVLTEATVSAIFGLDVVVIPHPTDGHPVVLPSRTPQGES